ncbi:hypothetical protein H0A72_17765 [Parapusillimonas granuli]|uniref:Uncharacterized protein n=1 Tax=Parapusillimonas granuli TaxID=380911 RepID=A0A853FYM9_9BURK|nr:hypothetical protein [Parapusillimonas granuli]NYT51165.1 hypothetical protein [Parapusillimonas granuli]
MTAWANATRADASAVALPGRAAYATVNMPPPTEALVMLKATWRPWNSSSRSTVAGLSGKIALTAPPATDISRQL